MANLNDILKVRIVAAQANQIGVMVRHYLVYAKAGTGATPQQIATALDAAWAGPMKALMCTLATYRGVGVQTVIPLPISVETIAVAGNGPGTAGGDPLPMQVSGLLSWRSASAGPFYRGRNYIPFPSEGDNDTDGKPTAGYVARCGTLATAMYTVAPIGTGGNTNTITPCIFHRQLGSYTPLTAVFTTYRWATQRRRGVFGQGNALPF